MLLVTFENNLNGFENITLCPYDKNLLDEKLLTQADKDYINAYHKRVYDTVAPLIEDDQETIAWLRAATDPI